MALAILAVIVDGLAGWSGKAYAGQTSFTSEPICGTWVWTEVDAYTVATDPEVVLPFASLHRA